MKSFAETNLKKTFSWVIPASAARCMTGIQTWLMIQFQAKLSTIYWGMVTPFWVCNFEFKMWYKVCYDWLEYIEVMHSGVLIDPIDMLYLMLCLYESFYHTDCLWRLRSMRYRGRSTWHWWTLHYTMTTAGRHINIKMVGMIVTFMIIPICLNEVKQYTKNITYCWPVSCICTGCFFVYQRI